jgi:ectoine hydroxylase-related dioxygenase (phytanoyl-CoA dioxygenase family)
MRTIPRLTAEQVAFYRREGYLLPVEPVFPKRKFQALRDYFEELLAQWPADKRPEGMDVPHFTDPKLMEWLLADEVLDLVEPLIGPDIALFSSHFICKPKGNGKRVPWHEDSAYWKTMLSPMEVVTVWLAIDPSTPANGCMYVIPLTHNTGRKGFSDYDPVDPTANVFPTEITPTQRNDALAVPCVLNPGQCSLHDGRLMHGSPPNTSAIRRCGYTMRYVPTTVKLNTEAAPWHQLYLARGRDHAGNQYGNPTRKYAELLERRPWQRKNGH